MYSIHNDPKYYPNPEIFDPERFTVDEKSKRKHITFFPFGEGPRHCIGMLFKFKYTYEFVYLKKIYTFVTYINILLT